MKRNTGLVLILVGIALGIWAFMAHEKAEPDVKIGDLEISDHKERDYPVTTLVLAGVAVVLGVAMVAGKKAA